MTDLHAIFRAVDGGRWQTYSRPDGIYVSGATLDAARQEFRSAAEFHFSDEWASTSLFEHVEREAALGIYIRTAIDDKTAARERTATVIGRSLDVAASMTITRAQALESSTGDIVFVCCEPDDRIRWVSGQLGRTDAVQVCAPLMDEGIWWIPLATPAKGVPASESETLAEAGLGGDEARVGQLPAVAERYAERAARERRDVTVMDTSFMPTGPTLVAA